MAPVLYVHIGKTGGGTLHALMRTRKIPVDVVHVHPTPIAAFVSHPHIVVSVRDPIARFVSVFNKKREELLSNTSYCFRTPNELVE